MGIDMLFVPQWSPGVFAWEMLTGIAGVRPSAPPQWSPGVFAWEITGASLADVTQELPQWSPGVFAWEIAELSKHVSPTIVAAMEPRRFRLGDQERNLAQ
ncbi:hypothetical protein MXEN_06421 [Mycobacterium xenopi RIVM700367]|nr:hypothetical protein MXEN_06421 [Mycobacterium xenopi RIVM700367]